MDLKLKKLNVIVRLLPKWRRQLRVENQLSYNKWQPQNKQKLIFCYNTQKVVIYFVHLSTKLCDVIQFTLIHPLHSVPHLPPSPTESGMFYPEKNQNKKKH